jgi:hypothetical protein
MIMLPNAEKSAERHHRIRDISGAFIDHDVINRPEGVSTTIINCRAFDFA